MKLSPKFWCYAALTLPLVLPGMAWLVMEASGYQYVSFLPRSLLLLCLLLVGQLSFGGVPYLLFLLGIVIWLRKKSVEQMLRVSWVLPLLFAVFLVVFYVAYLQLLGGRKVLVTSFTIGALAIPYAYFYVFLAHGLRKLASCCDKSHG